MVRRRAPDGSQRAWSAPTNSNYFIGSLAIVDLTPDLYIFIRHLHLPSNRDLICYTVFKPSYIHVPWSHANMVKTLPFGDVQVQSPGFGAMGLSFGFGSNLSLEEAEPVLLKAIELGCTFWDTAVCKST